MITRRIVLGAVAVAIAAPAVAQPLQTRPFRMGVTRWPPDLTLEAVAATDRFIADECDMAAPMILGGVPWTEALSGAPFSQNLNTELAYRPPQGHKLLLSIGPLDTSRRAMAPYWGQTDNRPIPAPFAGLTFDDARTMRAYSNFAIRACEATRPDWLAIGIESNLLLHNAPALWPAYKALHRHAYERIKARFPNLPVLFTMEVSHLLGLSEHADGALQRREMLDLMRHSDLAAFSVYPHMSWEIPRPLPTDFFDFAKRFAEDAGGKPIGVTESGYTSRNVMIGTLPLFGSPRDQQRHFELLLETAHRDRFAFIVNFASHDFERLTRRLSGQMQTLSRIWTYTGIVRGDGRAKPGTAVWRRYRAMRYARTA
ncbi:MAG: hypothetical protein ABL864_12860 [Terricaulis sp.]